MKRRICSILLALVLCIGLLPASARAETQKPWDTETDWTQLTGEHSGKVLNGGKYYLDGDVAITTTIHFRNAVTLDLNGYTLSFKGSGGEEFVLSVADEFSNLILQDSGTGGCIDGGNKAGGVMAWSGSSFTMNGGTIQNCCSPGNGSVYIAHGSFTMNGGSITGSSANNCPDVLLLSSTMYANGGTVEHIITSKDGNRGTITRSATGTEASTYTTFTGTVSGDGTIDDAAKLTVTFESNGGSTVATQKVLKGQKASEPTAPTRTGYAFSGWYSNETCTTAYNFGNAVMDHMTLYAKWTPNGNTPYTVEYYYMDTTGSYPETADQTDPMTGTTDAAIDLEPFKTAGAKTGFTFEKAEPAAPTIAGSGNTVVKLYYSRNQHTVTFDSNGGSAVAAQTVDRGAAAVEPKAPTKASHRFDGWYLDGEKYDFSTPVTGDITLTASWTFLVDPDKLAKPEEKPTGNPFVDISAANYFHDAVLWAVENGVTGGTDATHFSPFASCSRAQAVTFLYRSALALGLDVSAGEDTNILSYNDAFDIPEYAIPAVQWACGMGIVTGNNGNLNPNSGCTRAQIVAFLWRFAKAAGLDVSVGEDTNILSYNDAFDVPEYAIPAFQWACGESVVTGSNGDLNPNEGCTRAQIVTFLWRLLAE